jgi:dephospho-CoA kinase
MVVGLTGGYCAGKDAVARSFSARGYTVIDVDAVGHAVLQEKADEVVSAFGPGIRRDDGSIDRRALGRIVFSDPRALARHEAIMHPAMAERVRAMVRSTPGNLLINAAVLYKLGLDRVCDAVVCVTAPLPLRVIRAVRRDRVSAWQALRRILSQRGLCPKSHGRAVDTHSVRNAGSLRRLERDLGALLGRLKEMKGL